MTHDLYHFLYRLYESQHSIYFGVFLCSSDPRRQFIHDLKIPFSNPTSVRAIIILYSYLKLPLH